MDYGSLFKRGEMDGRRRARGFSERKRRYANNQYLQSKSYVNVDWKKVSSSYDNAFVHTDAKGDLVYPTPQGLLNGFIDFLTANFQREWCGAGPGSSPRFPTSRAPPARSKVWMQLTPRARHFHCWLPPRPACWVSDESILDRRNANQKTMNDVLVLRVSPSVG